MCMLRVCTSNVSMRMCAHLLSCGLGVSLFVRIALCVCLCMFVYVCVCACVRGRVRACTYRGKQACSRVTSTSSMY